MSGVTTVSVSTEAAAGASAPATVERPEYIPEKFWKGSVEEATKAMSASYAELERKQSGSKPEATPAATSTPATTTPAGEPSTEPSAEQQAVSKAVESALTKAAGSEDGLKATMEWARVNASDAQRALFDAALDTGNPELVEIAFGKIKQAYTEAVGEQGQRITGESAPVTTGAKPFGSQHEIAEFVNSKAYKSGDKRAHAEYEARMKVTTW